MLNGKRLLLLVSERVGDVIFCTPAIHALAAHCPQSVIDVVAPSQAAREVLSFNPAIRQIYAQPAASALRAIGAQYDVLLDFHNNRITKQLRARLAVAQQFVSPRIGTGHQSETATQFVATLLEMPIAPIASGYALYPQPQHYERVSQLLSDAGLDRQGQAIIGCHLGSNTTLRRGWKFWKPLAGPRSWPVASFGQAMALLAPQYPALRFVLTGTKAELPLAQQLRQFYPDAIVLVAKTSVLELAALMAHLRVFITGDTGPMHIACAMNRPLVGLFGPSAAHVTGPYPLQPHHVILQAVTIEKIRVDQVVAAVQQLLG